MYNSICGKNQNSRSLVKCSEMCGGPQQMLRSIFRQKVVHEKSFERKVYHAVCQIYFIFIKMHKLIELIYTV